MFNSKYLATGIPGILSCLTIVTAVSADESPCDKKILNRSGCEVGDFGLLESGQSLKWPTITRLEKIPKSNLPKTLPVQDQANKIKDLQNEPSPHKTGAQSGSTEENAQNPNARKTPGQPKTTAPESVPPSRY